MVQIVRLEAEDYGVPQERTRILIVGMSAEHMGGFRAPPRFPEWRTNLGDALGEMMAELGWQGAKAWAEARRQTVVVRDGVELKGALASTVVGRKGGSRSKEVARWASKGIDINNVADRAPTQAEADLAGEGFLSRLTLGMRARLQSPHGGPLSDARNRRRVRSETVSLPSSGARSGSQCGRRFPAESSTTERCSRAVRVR
ncbi:DNA cytosine methyltransferase [Rhizobium hidalgonense]|uniref:DNA cytosine methyltransferase n=1 Tax=Rhizobium hidalgonense TaxID=1538159 RepID=UPI002871D8F9|nr:DNA cytosine methyltransferase [Rhizobium hidalgonense]MDR9810281.1 hypothetical protein [Rhizobium hidalgonense]MDR9818906.1 hypothetical protein [Rhizobium hidalgonense]